jgi:hypothetical protein
MGIEKDEDNKDKHPGSLKTRDLSNTESMLKM